MDIKKISLHRRAWGKRKKGDTAKLAAQLAPLEELDPRISAKQTGTSSSSNNGQSDPDFGAIIVDNDHLHVSKDMLEGEEEKRFLGMEPVVLVILSVMLAFIAFIAWQISQMPAK